MSIAVENSQHEIISVIQGEFAVSQKPNAVMSTVLGSCIGACLFDPEAGIGGMNHFLLPEAKTGDGQNVKFGAYLMELLINRLLRAGAARNRLQAKLAGGGKMNQHLKGVGEQNIAFARRYLENESIPIVWESLGGIRARRINFVPTTGVLEERFVANDIADTQTRRFERPKPQVELF